MGSPAGRGGVSSSAGSVRAPRRRWLKCNFPIFLDFVVAAYIYMTLAFLSEWALESQYEYFKAQPEPTPSPTARINPRHLFRTSKRNLVAPDGHNAFAHVLAAIHLPSLAGIVGMVPDIAIACVLAFLTLRALHIAALSDPGSVPDDYEAPAWVDTPAKDAKEARLRQQQQEQDDVPSGGGGGGDDAQHADGVSVKCVPTPASALMNKLSMPGTSGPTGLPGNTANHAASARQYVHPNTAGSRQKLFSPHYCSECRSDRPLRTHHCRYCNACCVRFDHHCDWIDNCVGQRNHQCFFLFIFYILLCIVHYCTMLGRYFTSKSVALEPSIWVVVHLIGVCSYCMIVFPCGILAVFFIFNTSWQLLRDETTIEANFPKRYPTRKLGGKTVMVRLRSVLGSSPLWWWWPALQPLRVLPGEALAETADGPVKYDDAPTGTSDPAASQSV